MTRSSTPGGNIDHIAVGDIHGAFVHTLHGNLIVDGRADNSRPRLIGVLPPLAVGRLDRPADGVLEAAVAPGGQAPVACQVLTGLGGVGKTQLAANLAYRWWDSMRVDLLVWVTATSRTAVLTRLAQAAGAVTGVEDADPAEAAVRLLGWLASTSRRWLIVLDDLADPADLHGLWPPTTAAGTTVVTTRRRDDALLAGRAVIDVGVFTAAEAVTFLGKRLDDRPDRLDQATDLAGDLGHLPLAMAQAATYIADQNLTCSGYRQRLRRRGLAALRPAVLPDDQAKAVADTWALSIETADQHTGGVAGVLLQLAALLDPNGIPAGLFTTAAVAGCCTARAGRPVDGDDVHDGLRALHRLGLLTAPSATGGAGLVRVHAVLQRVVWEHIPTGLEHERTGAAVRSGLCRAAADALAELWPEIERDAADAQALRANVMALHRTAGGYLWSADTGAHPVLVHAGRSLAGTGLVAAAAGYFHDLHATAVDRLGPDHAGTIRIRLDLVDSAGQAGGWATVTFDLERMLADALRKLGPDHRLTLDIRMRLTSWWGETVDPHEAAAGFERLLTDQLRVLGPDHPTTLVTRRYLARYRGEAGDPAGSLTALEHLLADQLRVLGPDHHSVLVTRLDLAVCRGMAADAAGAAADLQRLLTEQLRVLGPGHPDVLVTRQHLARYRGEAGDRTGALVAFEQILTDQLQALGPDHPHLFATRLAIGSLRHTGRGAGAEPGECAD